MKIIKKLYFDDFEKSENEISLSVERRVLAKRRWRGQAEDGTVFGFDLEIPLQNRVCFHAEGKRNYIIAQKPEPVFQVSFSTQREAAHLAWQSSFSGTVQRFLFDRRRRPRRTAYARAQQNSF